MCHRTLRSFIIQSSALKLYRDLIKAAPSHIRDDWIAQVRFNFEMNRNADENKAWYLIGDGQKQLKEIQKWSQ